LAAASVWQLQVPSTRRRAVPYRWCSLAWAVPLKLARADGSADVLRTLDGDGLVAR